MTLARLSNLDQGSAPDGAMGTGAASGLVPVIFADSPHEAELLCSVLDGADVPALVGCNAGAGVNKALAFAGVPVLVPEYLHDRASEILATLEAAASGDWNDDKEDEDDEEDDDFDDDEDFLPDDDDDLDEDEEDEDEDDDFG